MRADAHTVVSCQSHGRPHQFRVPCVRAACDIGLIQIRHHCGFAARAFGQITIQFHAFCSTAP